MEGNTLREDELTQIEAKDAIANASGLPCESIAELLIRSYTIQ